MLSVDHGLGKLISVDLGAVNLRIVLTDLGGNTLAYHKLPSRVTEGPEVALGGLVTQISQILNEERVSVHDLAGIGIGISAVLDRTTGITRSWPKVPKWTNIPVQQIIADHFNTLVAIDDSVRTSAMVERRTGGTADARHFVYINIGAGTGAAIFLNNELYTGNNGFAGEFGHMLVAEQGPPCACGGRGCVETLASGSAMIRSAKEGFVEAISPALWELCQADANNISVELMSKAATKGDRFCLEVFNRAGGFLGTAILSLANLLDPQLIVLGGGAAVAAGELFNGTYPTSSEASRPGDGLARNSTFQFTGLQLGYGRRASRGRESVNEKIVECSTSTRNTVNGLLHWQYTPLIVLDQRYPNPPGRNQLSFRFIAQLLVLVHFLASSPNR